MADGKRQNVAGKVATPRTGASSPAASPTRYMDVGELSKAIGARLKLTTSAPNAQTVEGTLFTVCPTTQLVAVNTRNAPADSTLGSQLGDYRVIPIVRIQSFQVLPSSAAAENAETLNILPPDHKRLSQRESDRVRKLKEEEQSRGKGVSAEGQAIFDSFRRINTPIRWHNQEMIVHDAVIISPPYTVDDCRGAKDKQETLNRVKKVLEGERRKIKERDERERRGVGHEGTRKGG